MNPTPRKPGGGPPFLSSTKFPPALVREHSPLNAARPHDARGRVSPSPFRSTKFGCAPGRRRHDAWALAPGLGRRFRRAPPRAAGIRAQPPGAPPPLVFRIFQGAELSRESQSQEGGHTNN